MHGLYEIRAALMRELEDYEGKNMKSLENVKCVHMLTDTIKNIDKIETLGGGSSQRMSRESHRSYYDDGYSERGYARTGRDDMADKLGEMMDNANQHERGILEKAMRQLRSL